MRLPRSCWALLRGTRRHLLMAHGVVDNNVHFLDTVRLTQRLIELKKENWEWPRGQILCP